MHIIYISLPVRTTMLRISQDSRLVWLVFAVAASKASFRGQGGSFVYMIILLIIIMHSNVGRKLAGTSLINLVCMRQKCMHTKLTHTAFPLYDCRMPVLAGIRTIIWSSLAKLIVAHHYARKGELSIIWLGGGGVLDSFSTCPLHKIPFFLGSNFLVAIQVNGVWGELTLP
jgi:hypothetical protein